MRFREAMEADIPQLHTIRNSVKENALSNQALIKDADYKDYLFRRGKGWICELDEERVAGFAIADLQANNVWALFVHPHHEGKGIGLHLHQRMLDWYFSQTDQTLWLSTAPRTRAESFYRTAGWSEAGLHGQGELRFEMTFGKWQSATAAYNR